MSDLMARTKEFITLLISANNDDVYVIKCNSDLSDFSSEDIGEITAYALCQDERLIGDFARQNSDQILLELSSRLPENFNAELVMLPDNSQINPKAIDLIIVSQANVIEPISSDLVS